VTVTNLLALLDKADATDRLEGRLAYVRYREMMGRVAQHYGAPLDRTTAAFVAMSPNNDYLGNLRSLVSVLHWMGQGYCADRIAVSSYGHCKIRAMSYLRGEADFLETAKGKKIRAFYHNIMYPDRTEHVTVDGHMVCAWRAQNLTMKQAIIRNNYEYDSIVHGVRAVADRLGMIPCEVQATIWFVRKRTARVLFDPQLDMFDQADDRWRTLIDLKRVQPYGLLP
jgi:hypothetical protein